MIPQAGQTIVLGFVPHAVAFVEECHLLPFEGILPALILANAVIDRVNNGDQEK
jgi:hypothetical protein